MYIMCIVIMQNWQRKPLQQQIILLPYSAAMQKNNFYGVQFHTEKSADVANKSFKFFKNYIDGNNSRD